jgi:hypothetical protein
MSEGWAIGLVTLAVTVVMALGIEWWKERRRLRKQPSAPPPPLPAPPPLHVMETAKDYPAYLEISKLPTTGPRILLPYATPLSLMREIAAIQAPLAREDFAEQNFVGRWVRWTGTVFGVADDGGCYRATLIGPRGSLAYGSVALTFPLKRRAEVEVLREGQEITYEGQICRASEISVQLVRVDILPTA